MCCIESIIIPFDISGRSIHKLVYFTQGLQSSVYIAAHGRTINCKSIIGVISLGLKRGDSIQVSVVNDDETESTKDVQRVLSYIRNCGEEV